MWRAGQYVSTREVRLSPREADASRALQILTVLRTVKIWSG